MNRREAFKGLFAGTAVAGLLGLAKEAKAEPETTPEWFLLNGGMILGQDGRISYVPEAGSWPKGFDVDKPCRMATHHPHNSLFRTHMRDTGRHFPAYYLQYFPQGILKPYLRAGQTDRNNVAVSWALGLLD